MFPPFHFQYLRSGAPLEVFFFEDEDSLDDVQCKLFLGDGVSIQPTIDSTEFYFFDKLLLFHCTLISILPSNRSVTFFTQVCNKDFNIPSYNYDEGDCCAATCDKAQCGVGTMNKAFNTDISGDGFPMCEGKNWLYIIKINCRTKYVILYRKEKNSSICFFYPTSYLFILP